MMAITALYESIDQTRADFLRVRECAQVLASELQLHDPVIISMGMSADFEVAIQEGATHIRVGTALFGER